jgi:hypothetical protein
VKVESSLSPRARVSACHGLDCEGLVRWRPSTGLSAGEVPVGACFVLAKAEYTPGASPVACGLGLQQLLIYSCLGLAQVIGSSRMGR